MAFENYDNDIEKHPDHGTIVKELKKEKRLRVASSVLITWYDLRDGMDPFVMEVANDGVAKYNNSIAQARIIELLEKSTPENNLHQILLELIKSTSFDVSWTINAEWYFDLVCESLFDSPDMPFIENRGRNIANFIRRSQGLTIEEKIHCIIDIYANIENSSLNDIKRIINNEHKKIEKLINWLNIHPEHEKNKIHHVENAIKRISNSSHYLKNRKECWAKSMIVTNRNQKGFCDSVLTSARKTWSQQSRRESGNSKQLGLSVKKETAEMLKAIAKKNSLSETQTLEILIKSEFKTEVHMKEFSKILAAIEKL